MTLPPRWTRYLTTEAGRRQQLRRRVRSWGRCRLRLATPCPGRSPVSCPPEAISVPLTKTCSTPTGWLKRRPAPPGKIVPPADPARGHRLGIEKDHVGPVAVLNPAHPRHPVQGGRDVGQGADDLWERHRRPLPGQGQESDGVVEGRQHVDVGTRIGGADDHPGVFPGIQAQIPAHRVITDRRPVEPGPYVGRRQLAEHVEGLLAPLAGQVPEQATLHRPGLVRVGVQHPQVLEPGKPEGGGVPVSQRARAGARAPADRSAGARSRPAEAPWSRSSRGWHRRPSSGATPAPASAPDSSVPPPARPGRLHGRRRTACPRTPPGRSGATRSS